MKYMTLKSDVSELIPLEQKKLIKSFFYAVSAILAYMIIDYLNQYGLPEQFKAFTPLVPVAINLLDKWAREHHYVVPKE